MLLLSEISLYPATREQTIASWKRTAVEWGTGLTLEEYIDRELVGEKEEFARGGKQITWVLAPRNDPTTLDFFCSCETFKRKIAISHPAAPGQTEPTVEQGFGYGIASVFTPPQHRGKGFARHMMRLLHWVLSREEYISTLVFPETWGAPPDRVPNAGDAFVAVLWSDIGPKFYKGCAMGLRVGTGEEGGSGADGWVVRSPESTDWDVRGLDLPEVEGGVTWLDEESAKRVWGEDTAKIKAEVVEATKAKGKTYFSFLPNEGVAEFQWFRLHYHFSKYVQNPPRYCGLRIGEGGAFATWTCEYRPCLRKTLILTRLRANEEEVERLMAEVLKYTRNNGLDVVEAWNLPPDLEKALSIFGGVKVEREEHLPALKWYGKERVEWMLNERFCWC
ncbi:hypothetical protein AN958_05760 [Leucoagaricus sp. SymC.cos]|nr:hypothetical protein AN958_05757 [Leucoagaricus sp. SymC.cos]KXN89386.1 hypothetical protein AN958_05759 [Leucoagaricus sp. SymC.cos]KXN89387.1 hypothetical protein AN958_05760 [Leucoagaricus sp. SymC.cos]